MSNLRKFGRSIQTQNRISFWEGRYVVLSTPCICTYVAVANWRSISCCHCWWTHRSIICSNACTQHDGRRWKASNRREEENAKERDEGLFWRHMEMENSKGSDQVPFHFPLDGNWKGNPRENVDKLELVYRNIPHHIRINRKRHEQIDKYITKIFKFN